MGSGIKVHLICRILQEDRVISRMTRSLMEALGWSASSIPDPSADVNYYLGYYEAPLKGKFPSTKVAAYFTHREEDPGNDKALLWDRVAERADLRIVTCELYRRSLLEYGSTLRCSPPLERSKFTISPHRKRSAPVIGVSGFTYLNKRKGEDILSKILADPLSRVVRWVASGRGWPIPSKRYVWAQMEEFYQGLDLFVCTSRVEGIPMPPLEALSCGVKIVIPRGVGILDEIPEIPEIPGIYRYEKGDPGTLRIAIETALDAGEVDREKLRELTLPYSMEQWVEDNRRAVEDTFSSKAEEIRVEVPREDRGIYCVAFGDPAREVALRMMRSVKRFMPDIPITLCAAKAIGPEDRLVTQPDSDIGGRRAKLRAWDLTPPEWKYILYLDADTILTAPVYQLFRWVESGWDFAICRDINRTLGYSAGTYSPEEFNRTLGIAGSAQVLQYNGGVWAFSRNSRTEKLFQIWKEEWELWGARDQLSLIRSIYQAPVKLLLLGNEWNTFPKYQPTQKSAGILHYPGDARRWHSAIPGRIDSPEAWDAVKIFETRRRNEARSKG